MAYAIGGIVIRVGADTSKLSADLAKAGRVLAREGEKFKKIGASLSTYVSLPLGIAGAASIKFASDVEESLNKVRVAFGQNSKGVEQFAKTSLKSFGIAEGSALDMAALFGDMATSMGLSTGQAETMSKSLVGLAGDLASFKNIKVDVAQTALAGIFTGETESLKKLGIVMTEANVEAYALSKGLKVKFNQLTQNEKVLLRYNFVMDATKNAQGDFTRTSGGAANQMRTFGETIKELGANFGSIILPYFTKIVTKANELLQAFNSLDPATKKTIVVIAGLAAAAGPALSAYGYLTTTFASLLKLLPGMITSTGGVVGVVSKLGVVGAIAYAAYENWDKITKMFEDFTEVMKGAYKESAEFKIVVDGIAGAFKLAGALISFAFGTILDYIRNTATKLFAFGKLAKEALNPFDGKDIATSWKEFNKTATDSSNTMAESVKKNFLEIVSAITDTENKVNSTNRGGGLAGLKDAFTGKASGGVGLSDVSTVGGGKEDKFSVDDWNLGQIPIGGNFERGIVTPELSNIPIGVKLSDESKDKFKNELDGLIEYTKNTTKTIAQEIQESFDKIAKKIQEIANISTSIFSAGLALAQSLTDKATVTLDNRIAKEKEAITSSTLGEEQKAKKLAEVDKKFAGERKKIMRQTAIQQKAAGIFAALINTAEGVSKALSLGPPGIPLAAVIGGLGLAQVATIASTPLPALAKGTDRVKKSGLSIIHKDEAIVPAKVAEGGFSRGLANGVIEVIGRLSGTDMIIQSKNSGELFSRMYA